MGCADGHWAQMLAGRSLRSAKARARVSDTWAIRFDTLSSAVHAPQLVKMSTHHISMLIGEEFKYGKTAIQ